MAKKQFKTESKKLLDMMINSIYTHKEVFLRELISNASDACDKLRFRALTDQGIEIKASDYAINLALDKEARTLTVSDNGCGMTAAELESNLGTIAKSGSFEFKKDNDFAGNGNKEDAEKPVDIIGQFGVGFYSAFMVSDKVTVVSRVYGEETGSKWESEGASGYTIETAQAAEPGTTITLHIKPDTEGENYSKYLEEYTVTELVKKYSDYIHYPIRMALTKSRKKEGSPEDKPEYEQYSEVETLNSMVPLWKKPQSEVSEDEYNSFYQEKFYDYEKPVSVIRQVSEGTSEFTSLLFIPGHAPYDYYTRDFEKGLQLYSSGVLIMEKCKDLLPDYFGFVRGLVDSADLSLNISREMLQHDRQLKVIARAVEKKITAELKKLLEEKREDYEKFFEAFGTALKYGVYSDYGMHKDVLQDLLLFASTEGDKPVTLSEYVSRMKEDQKTIYYAAGESAQAIKLLPQVEAVTAKGYEVLILTEDVDEFALKMLRSYSEKDFANVCKDDLDLATEAEKELVKTENDENKEMLAFMKQSLGDACDVKFTRSLGEHPVCIGSAGDLSVNMEKTLNKMPGETEGVKAQIVMEINLNHPIAAKLKELYADDKDKLAQYSKILYAQARLISGMSIDNAADISDLVCRLMV